MKRLISLLLILAFLLFLSGCGPKKPEESFDVAFIAVEGRTDEPVCIECLAVTEEVCRDKELELTELTASDTSVAVADAVEKAAGQGARAVIVYGREADGSVREHAGVRQIYVSSSVDGSGLASVGCLCFDSVSCGYLTGYAFAASGYNQVGFIGNTDRTSVDLGFGLVQGYCRGSEDAGAAEGSRTIRYWYAGDENEVKLEAVYWYGLGTQIIFTGDQETYNTVAVSQSEAPCFDLKLGSGAFTSVFRQALETALKEKGNFSVYTDGSYAKRPQELPDCFSRMSTCSDAMYFQSFRSLLGYLRPELLDFDDADDVGDPSACMYGSSVELIYYG